MVSVGDKVKNVYNIERMIRSDIPHGTVGKVVHKSLFGGVDVKFEKHDGVVQGIKEKDLESA